MNYQTYFKRFSGILLSLAALTSLSHAADVFPSKPLKIIVTAAPGGTTDIASRALADQLGRELGQSVLVENKAGAAGIIALQALIASPADGYTMAMGNIGTNAINYALYKSLPYKSEDMRAISVVLATPNVMVVNSSFPAKTVAEFVALAKANPGKYSFASSGRGQSIHMSGELFKEMAGIQIRHIPYKGRAQSLPDLVSGRISMLFDNLSSSLPLIKAGEVHALGVTTLKRSPAAPEIPTLAEQGLPGFEAVSWFSLMAPARLPANIQNRLNQLVRQTLSNPDVKNRLVAGGLEPAPGSPRELSRLIASESNKWGRVVAQSGAKLDQ